MHSQTGAARRSRAPAVTPWLPPAFGMRRVSGVPAASIIAIRRTSGL
jgi:hypothetical protein